MLAIDSFALDMLMSLTSRWSCTRAVIRMARGRQWSEPRRFSPAAQIRACSRNSSARRSMRSDGRAQHPGPEATLTDRELVVAAPCLPPT